MCLSSLISNINEVVCSILDTAVSSRDIIDEMYSSCPQMDQTTFGGGREVEDRQLNKISSDLLEGSIALHRKVLT